ncbi:MAG: peptide chain release factor N(5)-glutamine methyltransferase [Patescibacteria group bacterium]
MIMTIDKSLIKAMQKLLAKEIASARLDAEVLLGFVLKQPREYLLAHTEKSLKPAEQKMYSTLIGRRSRFEPIAYLIGRRDFYGLPIRVDSRVLIPRPETELLVEEVLKIALQRPLKSRPMAILDIGTGSGAIALALAKNLSQAKIWASDASADALYLAKKNASGLGLKITFIKSDLLKNVPAGLIGGAILIANLPYLDRAEIKDFPLAIKRGLKYEPPAALFAGKRGTALYEELFRQLNRFETRPAYLLIEIGSHNWRDFLQLAKKYFPAASIEVIKDLARRPRVLKIKF